MLLSGNTVALFFAHKEGVLSVSLIFVNLKSSFFIRISQGTS